MNILQINRGYRNLRRYQEIIGVLFKYGFGELLNRVHIRQYLHLGTPAQETGTGQEADSLPKRFRMALEELGPTFIKLGQVLSTRSLLLPPEYAAELAVLQDRVTPVPFDKIRETLRQSLKADPAEVFAAIGEEAMAAASLAQVHRAVLQDGTRVAVKVQRPGIRRTIEADIDILGDLARLLLKYVPESRRLDPQGVVRELDKSLHQELNYTHEARNADLFRTRFAADDTIYVPRVYWPLCSDQVLVTEELDGIKLSDTDALREGAYDRAEVARRGGRLVLTQIFKNGFFHADPHPGNIFVLPGNVIAFVDYGMVGRLDDDTKTDLTDILLAVTNRDAGQAVRCMEQMGMLPDTGDTRALRTDVLELIDRYVDVPLERMAVKQVLADVYRVIHAHDLSVPPGMVMLAKTLATFEEVGRMLDPAYEFFREARPFIRSFIASRYKPDRLWYSLGKTLREYGRLLGILPREITVITRKFKKGTVSVDIHHRGLEDLENELVRTSSRLSLSLIIAALIVGSALIMRLDKGMIVFGYPVVGIAGFSVAVVLAVILFITVVRGKKY